VVAAHHAQVTAFYLTGQQAVSGCDDEAAAEGGDDLTG